MNGDEYLGTEQLALDLDYDADEPANRVLDQASGRCGGLDVLVTVYGDGSMTAALRVAGAALWGQTCELRPC